MDQLQLRQEDEEIAAAKADNRHRGKGQQKVTVEHVDVHAGGQPMVGTVNTSGSKEGGGVHAKTEEQSYAKQITDAPEPEMRSAFEANRQIVPKRSDEER